MDFFFWLTRVGENHLCVTQAITIWSFLWKSIKKKKNVLIEILELPFTPRHIKKQESHPHLGYIHLPLIDFCCCLSPSLSVACYRCTTKDIFEKRNVHECLQCPPHWNTWGKVSSLTLWSIPSHSLSHSVWFLPWWGFSFLDDGQFFSPWRVSSSNWSYPKLVCWVSSSKNLQQDPGLVCLN